MNLEHYDEQYVRDLWHDTIIENLLNEVLVLLRKNLPQEKQERYIKKAKKDLSRLPLESIKIMFIVYEHLKSQRKNYDDRINSLKPFIKAFEKAGVKP